MLGFKKTLKIALQASHTVRQAIWGLLLDGYTGVQIDRISAKCWGDLELIRAWLIRALM